MLLDALIRDVLIVLTAGLVAGAICKRLGASLLVGYLLVGALIGRGGIGLVTQENHELEQLASGGALLLLFALGIEFSMHELRRLSKYFWLGGLVQMLLVAVPITIVCRVLGSSWQSAFLLAAAGALSSTVLVFKTLSEQGDSATKYGRRAIGILLFQDVALVPLMLLVPMLAGNGEPPSIESIGELILKSALFLLGVVAMRYFILRWGIAQLAQLRSVELVLLLALSLLVGVCWLATKIGLPPAIGALATGVMLADNRMSAQIDSIVLPFRETFTALFFVTLGTLLNPVQFVEEPVTLSLGLLAIILLKATAAALALWMVGLGKRAALGMGLGLAQLGEFSFLIAGLGAESGVLSPEDYNRVLFIAIATLILTPQMLRIGLRWAQAESEEELAGEGHRQEASETGQAIVIGVGPIGRQIASRLEIIGVNVNLVDMSPVNLHAFAQQGFHTVAGDARAAETLRAANADNCDLAVVSVPNDEAALAVVKSLRKLNRQINIVVRCRYQSNINGLRRSGAQRVVSEEAEATGAILKSCESFLPQG